jgi:hypothetical protein
MDRMNNTANTPIAAVRTPSLMKSGFFTQA